MAVSRARSSLVDTRTEGMCHEDCSATVWPGRAWSGQWNGLAHVQSSLRPGTLGTLPKLLQGTKKEEGREAETARASWRRSLGPRCHWALGERPRTCLHKFRVTDFFGLKFYLFI